MYEASAYIENLGKSILDAVKVEKTSGYLLLAYTIMKEHNEALNGPLAQKLFAYHSERDMRNYYDQAKPMSSVGYYTKNVVSMLGDALLPEDASKLTLQEKEQHLKESVKEGQRKLSMIQKEQQELEDKYHQDVIEFEARQIKDATSAEDMGVL